MSINFMLTRDSGNVDEVMHDLASLSIPRLMSRKRAHDGDTSARAATPSPAKKQKQRNHFDELAPELILIIFHELYDDCDSTSDPMRALLPFASTSPYLRAFFKEHAFAIFRRGVNHLLQDALADTFVQMTPRFCDLVVKLGVLRSLKPWPTCPVELPRQMQTMLVSPWAHGSQDSSRPSYLIFPSDNPHASPGITLTAQEREQLQPSTYSGILSWIRTQLFTEGNRFSKSTHFSDMDRSREQALPGMPHFSSPDAAARCIHPYDTRFEDYMRGWVGNADHVYGFRLHYHLGMYRRHVEVPWTEAETSLLASGDYIPCCEMEHCPRMPEHVARDQ